MSMISGDLEARGLFPQRQGRRIPIRDGPERSAKAESERADPLHVEVGLRWNTLPILYYGMLEVHQFPSFPQAENEILVHDGIVQVSIGRPNLHHGSGLV